MQNGKPAPDFVRMRKSVLALLYCYTQQGCRLLENCRSSAAGGESPEWWRGKNCYRERYSQKFDTVINKLSVFRQDGFLCSAPFPWRTRSGAAERLLAWLKRSFSKPQDKVDVPRRFPGYICFLFRRLSENYTGPHELSDADQLMLRLWEAASFIDAKLRLTELTNVSDIEVYGRFWKAPTSRNSGDVTVVTVNEFMLAQYGEFEDQLLSEPWFRNK